MLHKYTRKIVLTTIIFASLLLILNSFGYKAYPWVKAVHIVAVIAWMAGLLYLPRLFVYHAGAQVESEVSETFKIMERRLLLIIMNPAMIATWVLGGWMTWHQEWYYSGWFIVKLMLVFIMSIVHGYFYITVRTYAENNNKKSANYWRLVNEIPTLLMITIIILVVVKPF
ncbi:MAG: hypothetical protein TECD_00078 [Hyphomicrobiaceae bacterium hypho_1]